MEDQSAQAVSQLRHQFCRARHTAWVAHAESPRGPVGGGGGGVRDQLAAVLPAEALVDPPFDEPDVLPPFDEVVDDVDDEVELPEEELLSDFVGWGVVAPVLPSVPEERESVR